MINVFAHDLLHRFGEHCAKGLGDKMNAGVDLDADLKRYFLRIQFF